MNKHVLGRIVLGFLIFPGAQSILFADKNVDAESFKEKLHLAFNQRGVRMYSFIAAALDTPQSALVDCTFSSLLQNAHDIGVLFVPFYGKAAGDHLEYLLQENAIYFGSLVEAIRKNNGHEAERGRFYTSIVPLASFFNKIDARWNATTTEHILREIFYVMYDQITQRHQGKIESQANFHLDLTIMLRDLADYFSRIMCKPNHLKNKSDVARTQGVDAELK